MHWIFEMSASDFVRKLRRLVLPNLHHLWRTRIRRCRACLRLSVFPQFAIEEHRFCMRCKAALRHEMMAEYIRTHVADMERLRVLELDPSSPLRPILSRAREYYRSFYHPGVQRGTRRADGARMEDITRLTFPDESLDLIVSSDVLEHVSDPAAAFAETSRVLTAHGRHLFTVPVHDGRRTLQRACIIDDKVEHLVTPPDYHYHTDPLDPEGRILVFWEYGPDMLDLFADCGLEFAVVMGPEGVWRRTIWEARKQGTGAGCGAT